MFTYSGTCALFSTFLCCVLCLFTGWLHDDASLGALTMIVLMCAGLLLQAFLSVCDIGAFSFEHLFVTVAAGFGFMGLPAWLLSLMVMGMTFLPRFTCHTSVAADEAFDIVFWCAIAAVTYTVFSGASVVGSLVCVALAAMAVAVLARVLRSDPTHRELVDSCR
ncbi:MAG: hypothetical protein RLZZ324_319 [Candidatus Parcubacteria bacterium]